jgi:hypothetical protein
MKEKCISLNKTKECEDSLEEGYEVRAGSESFI